MSKVIDNLLLNLEKSKPQVQTGEKLKVHTVISVAAFVYERIRNAVDYNEDHLVRKNAIYRILKRKLMLEKVILENYLLDKYHQDNLAEHLLQELIRGKYVEEVSLQTVKVIDEIIQKYNLLINQIKDIEGSIDKKFFNLLLKTAAVEIEQILVPPEKEKALARAMFAVLNPKIVLTDNNLDEKEKELQLYIGCFRALFKWDDEILLFFLLNLYYPDWKAGDEQTIKKLARNRNKIFNEFQKQLNHPWKKHINKILQKKAIIFHIINDIWEEKGPEAQAIFENEEKLEEEVQKACQKRYKGVGARLRRGVVRSIIYVFFTKMLLAILLEFPMDLYLADEINYTTLIINILFPPFLMFVVAILIRMPKKENTKKIIESIKEISFSGHTKKQFKLKHPKARGKIANFIFDLIYTCTFIFSIMIIFWILFRLNFNVFSSLIFVLFLTMVSFFGIRIRRPVKDLLAIDKRDNFLSAIIDFFTLPFVSMGRWMSTKFSKINFIAFFLDFIIEAPFKLLIEVIEDLFSFLKEKKEDVMSE